MEQSEIIRRTFPVTGMSCAACAVRVADALRRQPGVSAAEVNYATATVSVSWRADACPVEALREAVRRAGYDLLIGAEEAEEEAERIHAAHFKKLVRRTAVALALSLPVMVLGMGFAGNRTAGILSWLLATPVLFGCGIDFFRNAWRQLRHGTCNMDTLVATSSGAAYLFSLFNLLFPAFWRVRGLEPHLYFEAAAMIVAFVLLGRTLEDRAKRRTSAAIRKLKGLQPRHVTVATDGGERIIPIAELRAGDRVIVKPGERIAADGTVISGDSYVDESMLSGEPFPVHKCEGARLYAGTVNRHGVLCLRAEQIGDATLLARIICSVGEAQGSKAPVQRLVDRVAALFVPVIIGIAAVTLAAWLLFASTDALSHGILAAVTVLIIACPCALGLATPTAVMVGIGKGAEYGMLIRDAEALERARQIDTVVFDKTGTLTEGAPSVVAMSWSGDRPELRAVLCALERHSEHPIAGAIVKALSGSADCAVGQIEAVPGCGIRGEFGGRTYCAGSAAWLEAQGLQPDARQQAEAEAWQHEGYTVVRFADGERIHAQIAVADAVGEHAAEAVARLREMGIEVWLLTGDHAAAAGSVARKVGIEHLRAGVLPHEKAAFIRQLQTGGRKVAMVGDGINDSAALAQADLSVAMGRGSDVAIDAAMITVLTSDPARVPLLVDLSRQTMRIVRQNLFWAFFYNLIGVPVAAGALYPLFGFLLNPMIGSAAMAFSSVSVVTNSLRLRRFTPKTFQTHKIMKKRFEVSGMMCNHCRAHVEEALNSLEGVKASVTLTPPVATVECSREIGIEELQRAVADRAGAYQLTELK